MSAASLDDLGKLVLRLTVGILLLFHGMFKLVHGAGAIGGMMAAHGMPHFFGWAVYLGEILAPILMILGIYARLGGLLTVANMLVALALVHSAQLWHHAGNGGMLLELQYFYLFCGLSVALLGAGRYSLGGSGGRWN